MKKRIFALLMSICIVIGLMLQFPVTALAAEVDSSGTWGGIDWVLGTDGTLTISPTQNTITKYKPWTNPKELYKVGEWPAAVNDAISAVTGWPYDRSKVKKLVIEEGVTSIGSFTIQNCNNLTGEVVIPSTVTYIGQEAFQNDPITELTFASGGSGALCIAPGAFKKVKIEDLILPADRSEIHLHCWTFNDCLNLKSVAIPANVTTFSNWTHVDYTGFDYVNGYDSQLFARCKNLDTIAFANEEVRQKFLNAARNQANLNAIGDVERPVHSCEKSDWVRNENNHYKKKCVLAGCPIGQNQKFYDLGAHTFGADNFCTVCGYLRDTDSETAPPKTGDTTHTLLWTALFLGGMAMMWMQLSDRKREMF